MLNINFGAGARARVPSHCSSTTKIRLLGASAPIVPTTTAPATTAPFPVAPTVMVPVAPALAVLSGSDGSLSDSSGGFGSNCSGSDDYDSGGSGGSGSGGSVSDSSGGSSGSCCYGFWLRRLQPLLFGSLRLRLRNAISILIDKMCSKSNF
jgi:hypothetical protein